MEPYLQSYLEHIGITDGVTASMHACELCEAAEFVDLVDVVEIGKGESGKLPIKCCARCGLVMQNPRFNREFYSRYYDKYYRTILFGSSEPDRAFLADQVRRGEKLYASLAGAGHLTGAGKLLDVGCSAGGLMVAFLKRGWTGLGTDPDAGFVAHGRDKLQLPLVRCDAEDMELAEREYDLVIITGSLEHVYDARRTLGLCRRATRPGGLLFLEGRALGQALINGQFSHNHRRYLTASSLELFMWLHGWEPIWTTDQPLCGPTRPGGVYCLGRAIEPPWPDVRTLIAGGHRDDPQVLCARVAARGIQPNASAS
ncbi:MAG TPA: class I SAM-dependent methyltransferase [Kofleriaceae bacterium]|nr:class I SAM-dependent methyltransferase [Kofleriaceae bacterium]